MNYSLAAMLAAALCLAACGEKPQRQVPEEGSYNGVNQANPLADRTLHQGESRRFAY
jgi:hypothetical protein